MKMITEAEFEALQDRTRGLETPDDFWQAAVDMVEAARRSGVVLTVQQVSLFPPAMGHHMTVVSVRKAREPAC